MRLSKAVRISKQNVMLANRNSGTIEVYSGVEPGTVDGAITTQVLLVTFTIPVTSGVIDANAIFTANTIAAAVAVAAGTAGWYRQKDSGGTPIQDGPVSLSGGGGDMIIDSLTIALSQTINFLSWVQTEGNTD